MYNGSFKTFDEFEFDFKMRFIMSQLCIPFVSILSVNWLLMLQRAIKHWTWRHDAANLIISVSKTFLEMHHRTLFLETGDLAMASRFFYFCYSFVINRYFNLEMFWFIWVQKIFSIGEQSCDKSNYCQIIFNLFFIFFVSSGVAWPVFIMLEQKHKQLQVAATSSLSPPNLNYFDLRSRHRQHLCPTF